MVVNTDGLHLDDLLASRLEGLLPFSKTIVAYLSKLRAEWRGISSVMAHIRRIVLLIVRKLVKKCN